MVTPVANRAPVTAMSAPFGVLVGETIRAVLIYKNCSHPLLRAQLSKPLRPFQRVDIPANSVSLGLVTSSTFVLQRLDAALAWGDVFN